MPYSGGDSGYYQMLRDRAQRPDERFRELMNMMLMMKQTQAQQKNTQWDQGMAEKKYGLEERGQNLAEKQAGYMEPYYKARSTDLMREPVEDLSPDAKSFMFWKKRYPGKTDEEIHAIKNKWKTPYQVAIESKGDAPELERLSLGSKRIHAQLGQVLNIAKSLVDQYSKSFKGYMSGPEGLSSNKNYMAIRKIQTEVTKLLRKKTYTQGDVDFIDNALESLMAYGGGQQPVQPEPTEILPGQKIDKNGNIIG